MELQEANQQFSKAVKAVKARKEVMLTERRKPTAVLKPLPASRQPEEVAQQLDGWLRPMRVTSLDAVFAGVRPID
jgi:antitoxin (DNA-binding transcriptional repressor) of toxin-antitoxin stability system